MGKIKVCPTCKQLKGSCSKESRDCNCDIRYVNTPKGLMHYDFNELRRQLNFNNKK